MIILTYLLALVAHSKYNARILGCARMRVRLTGRNNPVKRKQIRFSPVEVALVGLMALLLLLNFWQGHRQES
jgi:hypothetical protein